MKFCNSEKELLIIRDKETDFSYGKKPEDRGITEHINNGIVVIDKPENFTSHSVSEIVKKILHLRKSGHTGTLDSNVTGVLPILLENSTKLSPIFKFLKRKYVGILRLHKDVSDNALREVFDHFTGKIYQMPPRKSAVKRVSRIREIYSLKFLEREGREILFEVECESGTYIRKLCHDIGVFLGVNSNMQKLRRIQVGNFDEKSITTLHELSDAYALYLQGNDKFLREIILPFEKAVESFEKIWISDSTVNAICHGLSLYAPGVCKITKKIEKGKIVAIMSLKDELVAIARAEMSSDEILNANSGIVATPKRVVMKLGTYPKFLKEK
ncbi:MAG: RNA-guided pseudouridylation complex pseudouridine synthase subunit Cbf5 [Candidatus Altiarchaeota archaeon]